MNFKIKAYPLFEREIKKLSKKYRTIGKDYQALLNSLKDNPYEGIDLGGGLHKIRMSISAKGKGKSGGARVITLVLIISSDETEIGLQYIYDKSECENLSDKELQNILKRNGLL